MNDDVAISVKRVFKDFRLGHQKSGTLKSLFTGLMANSRKQLDIHHALKDIDLEIKKGEFFGIVGRNGSGKSTLLKILAGIYQPNQGKVHVNGRLVPFIELGVGFNPELSGRDNVYLNGALLGFSKREVDSFYNEVVEFAELEEFMDQKLKNYSSGMQVRLAFSMAVRARADILLVDEVLAVGDADFQRKCYDYFKKLKKDKTTVVFVTHDMAAVREFCDRAALIEASKLKATGSPADVADMYDSLFMETSKSDKNLNSFSDKKRSGSAVVEIEDVQLNKSTFTPKDSVIELSVVIKGLKPSQQLMTGFAIKNAQGLILNSAHTWSLQEDLGLEVGKKCKVTWQCSNIYEDGLHTVDVYSWGKGREIYDRLEDVVSFRVKRSHRSGGLLTVPVDVSINDGPKQKIQ